jgi:hypothetical protein
MSEPEGRANHQHGAFSFLATKWRALIGADVFAISSMLRTAWMVHQMSEPEGRANHQHGAFSFLATKWRALIGADVFAISSMLRTARMVHQ